jgi:hypothetical protein
MNGDYFSDLARSAEDSDEPPIKTKNDAREWEAFVRTHHIGDVLDGTIADVTSFGLWVETDRDVRAFVHQQEVPGWASPIAAPPRDYVEGQRVRIRITSLNAGARMPGVEFVGCERSGTTRTPPPRRSRETPEGALAPEVPPDPDPFAPIPLDPVQRSAALEALAADVRAARRGATPGRVNELRVAWDALTRAENEDDFYARTADLNTLLARMPAVLDEDDG